LRIAPTRFAENELGDLAGYIRAPGVGSQRQPDDNPQMSTIRGEASQTDTMKQAPLFSISHDGMKRREGIIP
jgi:hypothetical protein